jgi:hypothetical protein
MELRPLGFGEIFDRAITLYIRNFVPFAGIVSVLIVPLAIVQYVLDTLEGPQFDAMIRILEHPERARTEHLPTLLDSPGSIAITFVSVFIAYIIWPFALNAVAVGVARLYRGKPVEFRACYAAVLHRWAGILAMLGVEVLVFMAWYVATIIVAVIVVLISAPFIAALPALAAISVMVMIVAVLAMMLLLAPIAVALAFCMYGVVIEERSVGDAVALGFTRVFNRQEFWRAVLFAISAGAIVLGATMMISAISLVAIFAHLMVLEVLLDSLARAAIAPFGVVLLAVYYFDVRIRREGYDLEVGLDRLAAGAVVPA